MAECTETAEQVQPLVDKSHGPPARLVEIRNDPRPLRRTRAGAAEDEAATTANAPNGEHSACHASIVGNIRNATVLVQRLVYGASDHGLLEDRFIDQGAHASTGRTEAVIPNLLALVHTVGVGVGRSTEEKIGTADAGHQRRRSRPRNVLEG